MRVAPRVGSTVSIQGGVFCSPSVSSRIEGVLEPERLRDFLYERMRGARGHEAGPAPDAGRSDEALRLLREIRDGLRALRADGAE